jgi:hypothetical protein
MADIHLKDIRNKLINAGVSKFKLPYVMGRLEEAAKRGRFGYGGKTPWKISEQKAASVLKDMATKREFGISTSMAAQWRGTDVKKIGNIISGGNSPKISSSPAFKKPSLFGKPFGSNPFIKR